MAMMMIDEPSPLLPTAAGKLRRWRNFTFLGGLLALFLIGITGLAAATGWREMLAQIAGLHGWEVLVLLALSSSNYLLRALRWHLFARRLGLKTGLGQDLRHFLGGFALSVTPGRVGELVRMRWLKRETGWPVERTAPLVLMDRASDLAAMGLMLALALVLSSIGVRGAVPVALLALIGAGVATHPRLLAGLVTTLWKLVGRWPRMFARARAAARSMARFGTASVTIPALLLGFAGWFAEGVSFHLLLNWFGADISLWSAVAIFTFATLAGGLTGAPGGIGGAEAAMLTLLALQGIDMEVAVPATAIIRATTLWFAIGIGIVVFPLAERMSKRGADALENA